MTGGFLFQALVYMTAAVVCVPLAKRLGLSSVLGYLIAGILIGPFLLGFIGEEGEDIMHFAEFGVVMMLFLIGLEINPKTFWHMRRSILGLGGSQVIITMGLVFPVMLLIEFDWQTSLTIAMAFSLSSTAIVLQTIKEKGLMDTVYGNASFSVLLFQDIAVIPMLALLPLFGHSEAAHVEDDGHGASFFDQLPGGWQVLAVLGSVLVVVILGRYVIVPVLRLVAMTRLRELFTASALLIVIAIAFLMQSVGLSPALGAFLAGVILANSEFRHELESTLEPFKGLLLGLFFMAVGASINFVVIMDFPIEVTLWVFGVMITKIIVLVIIGRIFKISTDQNLLFSVGLAQVGEFAFVLLSFSNQLKIVEPATLDLLLVVTALTMTLSPVLNIINERIILPRVGTKESVAKKPDEITRRQKVILVGFGHFGSTVGRFLRANGAEAVVLDHDSNRVDVLRKMGFEVFYGDATRLDLLESAGINEAEMLISAIDDPDKNLELVEMLKKHFPHVKLKIRAKSRVDAYQLLRLGVESVYRESLDTSVKMASDVLFDLGYRKHTVLKQAGKFIKYDEKSMRRLANTRVNSDDYISRVREEIAQQEAMLKADLMSAPLRVTEEYFDKEPVRDESK
jgi:CPA2 family monovalent cation:H+ antiporter-2